MFMNTVTDLREGTCVHLHDMNCQNKVNAFCMVKLRM